MRERGFWSDRLFDEFLAAAASNTPEKLAVIADSGEGAKRIAFSEFDDLVSRAAASLYALGLQKGDVVAMQSPNCWEAVVLTLACLRTGLVLNPLMPIFREHELSFMLGFADTKAFVVPKRFGNFDFEEMANGLRDKLPSLKHVIVIRGEGPNSFNASLLSSKERLSPLLVTSKDAPRGDDLAVLMYTSGTTGSPKGVMHTSNTLGCCVDNIIRRGDLTSDDVILVSAPIGHMIGFAASLLLSIRLGATMVLQETWNGSRAVDLMTEEGVSYSAGAPPHLTDICDNAANREKKPSHLRLYLCAGAPIPPALIHRAASELNLRVVSVWGMTESLASTMTEPERAFEKSSTTDGRALDGNEVKVVDASGNSMPAGTVGKLMVRGAQNLLGYYKRPDITLFDSDGWMDTGDLACMDNEGYIRIAGRTKDIIIRGGENIPVTDIESVLYEHPSVQSVALVGYPDARLGERACAFIQLRPGRHFDFTEMQAHLATHKVTKQFWPERLEILELLPRTTSGKIQKFTLRDQAKAFGDES
jgi:cyclohexanecarboxylate-CoA ligase